MNGSNIRPKKIDYCTLFCWGKLFQNSFFETLVCDNYHRSKLGLFLR
jgi:hypothetical protein